MVPNQSFLLAFDGSEEALYAAEAAWSLSKRMNASLTAQHVVDTAGALRFLNPRNAGVIGSGLHLVAYEGLNNSLRSIGGKLAEVYNARAEGHGISTGMIVDEGDPCEEILRRAADHSLIILGYSPSAVPASISFLHARLSLVEQLIHSCLQPLLIVRQPLPVVTELTAVSSLRHFNDRWLTACWSAAQQLGAQFSISLLPLVNGKTELEEFNRQLQESAPRLSNAKIRILVSDDKHPAVKNSSVLPVVPTVLKDDHRMTISGECPALFLRTSNFSSVLFWPEEYTQPLFRLPAASTAAV